MQKWSKASILMPNPIHQTESRIKKAHDEIFVMGFFRTEDQLQCDVDNFTL